MKQKFFSSDEYIELFDYLYKNGVKLEIEDSDNLLYIEKSVEYILFDSEEFIDFRKNIKILLFKEILNEIKKEAVSKKPRVATKILSDVVDIYNIPKTKIRKISNNNINRPLSLFTIESSEASIDSTVNDSMFED